MSDARYFLTDDEERAYSLDEISALIMSGSLVKDSYIWKEGTPEWVQLKQCSDFAEVFEEYERQAKELMDKALGQDKESLERKEMQSFLNEAEQEKISFAGDEKSWRSHLSSLTILLLVFLGSVAVLWLYTFVSRKADTKTPTVVRKQREKLNLNDLRFASGVAKLDSVKGIKVKKLKKSEEDSILREALIEEKKAEAEKEAKEAKKPIKKSLFDSVSDEELAAFRRRLLHRGRPNRTHKVTVSGSDLAGGEELTSKQIAETLKRYSGTIRSCYNKSLKNDPGLRGRMEVTIHILGNGSVAKVVNNTPRFKGTIMDRCVRTTIKKKWKFPSFKGTLSTVTLPFILSR